MSLFKNKKEEPSEIILKKEQFFDEISKKFNIEIKPSVVDSKIKFVMHRCIDGKNAYSATLVNDPFIGRSGDHYGEILQVLRLTQYEYSVLLSSYKNICDKMNEVMMNRGIMA